MTHAIKAGTILIEQGTPLPECLRFESEACVDGWRAVKNLDGYELDREIRDAGWTFFYMADEIRANVFGLDQQKAIARAVSRLLANPKAERFNSLQVTRIVEKRLLGLPYVAVSAHRRHIQESMVLFHSEQIAEWDGAKLAAA